MKIPSIYFLMVGLSSLATANDIVNLDRIGEILGFPSSQLVIEDYLEKERSAYRDCTLLENQNNISPPFVPSCIFRAYKISAKTKETFLPMIITVVARDTYQTEEIKKLEIQMKSLREVPAFEGGRLPFGDFNVSREANGFFLILPQMRVPARPIRLEHMPPEALTFVDHYPDHQPCNVSFMRVPGSDVDVRIAQYMGIENFENQIKGLKSILGGEKYFARFSNSTGDETSQEPPHKMILRVFKALNIEVLESPILNSFRKDQKPSVPVIAPNIAVPAQPIITEETKTLPAETPSAISSPLAKEKSWLWLWVIASLAALSLIILSVKRLKAKRS